MNSAFVLVFYSHCSHNTNFYKQQLKLMQFTSSIANAFYALYGNINSKHFYSSTIVEVVIELIIFDL